MTKRLTPRKRVQLSSIVSLIVLLSLFVIDYTIRYYRTTGTCWSFFDELLNVLVILNILVTVLLFRNGIILRKSQKDDWPSGRTFGFCFILPVLNLLRIILLRAEYLEYLKYLANTTQ